MILIYPSIVVLKCEYSGEKWEKHVSKVGEPGLKVGMHAVLKQGSSKLFKKGELDVWKRDALRLK